MKNVFRARLIFFDSFKGFLFIQLLFISINKSSAQEETNSINQTIFPSNLFFHTSPFFQLPKEASKHARINYISEYRGNIVLVTLRRVYLLSPQRKILTLLLDVSTAIPLATNNSRGLNIDNIAHGGVRGVAFHPRRFRLMYVTALEDRPKRPSDFNYISDVSNPVSADSVLIEFKLNDKMNRADPLSYRQLFRVGIPIYDHPIKTLAFRGELLYISHGDGSDQGAFDGGGQNPDGRGKIFRINPLQPRSGPKRRDPYQIPGDNPFVGHGGEMPPEVWAYGFRNPHHICFGEGEELFVAETGRANIEEVNVVRGNGENFGWSLREGPRVYKGGSWKNGIENLPPDDLKLGITYPSAVIAHVGSGDKRTKGQAIAGGCPITNGSPMDGVYLYADFPIFGKLFFSFTKDLIEANTKGKPEDLTMAKTYQPSICYNDDFGNVTQVNTLKDILTSETEFKNSVRIDVRIGRGPDGVIYWSSKVNGRLYVFTSSKKGGPSVPC